MRRKVYISDLVLEVTRRCNMSCAHCCRGEAQNCDITHKVIDDTFANLSSIGYLVFTGGEPSLNVDAIEYALEVCKRNNISVSSFYIVTNGKCEDKTRYEQFILACMRWYAYCDDGDVCGVALSKDIFHDEATTYAENLLTGLSFFRPEDKKVNWDDRHAVLVDQGRAKELGRYTKRDIELTWQNHDFAAYDDEICVGDGTVYVNVNGEVLPDCDLSYETQEECECKLKNMDMALTFFERAATDQNFRIA